MKKIIYTLAAFLLISSCRSIDKMIESGNYDDALRFGVDKLRGEKNKKTKYVKGLEKAYAKLNLQNLNTIKHLQLSDNKNNYDRIVDIYHSMENRQNYVIPLLPLISEEGYLAEIKIVDYSDLIKNASLAASEKHYLHGIKMLSRAKTSGNKSEAREAYDHFEDAQYYFFDYKDSYELKQEAYDLGISRILVETYINGSNHAFNHTLEIIGQINIAKLNNRWEKFYVFDNASLQFDYIATLEVNDIIPGMEREKIHSFIESKEIVDGQIPVKDNQGNVVKDTSGNILYTDKIVRVSAFVDEIQREKIAHMSGKVVVIDVQDNNPVKTIPIHVTHEFRDYSCTYKGDKRALTKPTFDRLKNSCNSFPSDFEITTTMAFSYKSAAENLLTKQTFKR